MDAKEDNNVTTAVAIADTNNHQFDKPIDMPDLVKIEDGNAAPQLDLQLKNSEEVLQQIPLVVAEGTDQLEMITVQAEENTRKNSDLYCSKKKNNNCNPYYSYY